MASSGMAYPLFRRLRARARRPVLVNHLHGLSDKDRRTLESEHGVRIMTPEWIVDLPAPLQTRRNLAVGIRCALPRVVPGYDIYLWFDCDGWVQDDKFYERYVDIARRGALAIVKEREPAYRFDPALLRWTLGNFVLGLGLWRGLRCFLSPPINAGGSGCC